MKTVEVKEINLLLENFYIYKEYPSDGLFLVNDMTTVDDYTILVYVKNSCVLHVGEGRDLNYRGIEEKKEVKTQNQISEDFFLKTLSLVVNKDESYKK
jgi:hypothetical protein